MLVLTRKKDKSIMLGDEIEIKVVDITGNQVKIGIEAPQEIDIYRKEIYKKIVAENQEASEVKVKKLGDIMNQLGKESKKGD